MKTDTDTLVLDNTGGWKPDNSDYLITNDPAQQVATLYASNTQGLMPRGTPLDWMIAFFGWGNDARLDKLKVWLQNIKSPWLCLDFERFGQVRWTTQEHVMMLHFCRKWAPAGTLISLYGLYTTTEGYDVLEPRVDWHTMGVYVGPWGLNNVEKAKEWGTAKPVIPFVGLAKQHSAINGVRQPVTWAKWWEVEELLPVIRGFATVLVWSPPEGKVTRLGEDEARAFAARIKDADAGGGSDDE